jgi:hypothetical protein
MQRPAAAPDVLKQSRPAVPGTAGHVEDGAQNPGDGTVPRAGSVPPGASPGKSLNQGRELAAGRRGSITFGHRDGLRQTDIRLFNGADLSTVPHESGHLYLELLVDLAERDGAPQDIRDGLATAMRWLAVSSPQEIGTAQHEQWAEW